MRWLLFSFILFLLFSCANKNEARKGIVHPKEMQHIVWEVMQADELALQNKLADSSRNLKYESFRLYDEVFAIHKISRAQYFRSYQYYQQRPFLYKELMDGVKQIAEKEKKATQISPK
jgi:hypothetical protein